MEKKCVVDEEVSASRGMPLSWKNMILLAEMNGRFKDNLPKRTRRKPLDRRIQIPRTFHQLWSRCAGISGIKGYRLQVRIERLNVALDRNNFDCVRQDDRLVCSDTHAIRKLTSKKKRAARPKMRRRVPIKSTDNRMTVGAARESLLATRGPTSTPPARPSKIPDSAVTTDRLTACTKEKNTLPRTPNERVRCGLLKDGEIIRHAAPAQKELSDRSFHSERKTPAKSPLAGEIDSIEHRISIIESCLRSFSVRGGSVCDESAKKLQNLGDMDNTGMGSCRQKLSEILRKFSQFDRLEERFERRLCVAASSSRRGS